METAKLSGLESAFLRLESESVPFVFACVLEIDRPIPLETLRTGFAAALAGAPRYRQRLRRGWLGDAWVDDASFWIDRHVREAAVAAPGCARDLDELVGQVLASPLPDAHPPWRAWTVRGLDGGRGAVITLVHHALVDGIAGFHMLEQILRGMPAEPPPPPVHAPVRHLASWRNVRALADMLRDGLHSAAELGLNPRHTSHARIVASHTVPLDEVRAIERAFGVTNNDVLLATVAGGLRRYLHDRGVDPRQFADVRAMVPVGRHGSSHDTAGNRVVMLLVKLPVDEPDPATALRRVSDTTRALKASHAASGGDLLVALGDATTPRVLSSVLRLALWRRAFNLLVTNVPGPATPLSMFGANVTRIVPIVNLWPHQSLGVASATYAGAMTIGVQADFAVISDVGKFRDDLAHAFDALKQ